MERSVQVVYGAPDTPSHGRMKVDEDLTVVDFGIEALGALFALETFTRSEVEAPFVPCAGDRSVANHPLGKRVSFVRATIVEDVDVRAATHAHERSAVGRHDTAGPSFGESFERTHRDEFDNHRARNDSVSSPQSPRSIGALPGRSGLVSEQGRGEIRLRHGAPEVLQSSSMGGGLLVSVSTAREDASARKGSIASKGISKIDATLVR